MSISMKTPYIYRSPYADELKAYIELRSLTLKESTLRGESMYTKGLDRYLSERISQKCQLSSGLMEDWIARSPWEKPITQKKRFDFTKRIFAFLNGKGIVAEMPSVVLRNTQSDYVPYVFTTDEIHLILKAADRYQSTKRSPYLHLVVPLAFRILYGCGLRCSELTGLRVRDVDFGNNSLCIWDTKFHRSRYVPFSLSLGSYIQRYISRRYPDGIGDEYLIGDPAGKMYQTQAVHYWHMKLLYAAGIPHGGKGCGPRVHDYRHTFAVHSLQNCVANGQDIMAVLPVLATYLGHKDLRGTQYYLHLTAEMYPHILDALDQKYGNLLEGGGPNET